MSRCIDADALIADCQLAQKQADRHGREFANAFYSGGGEVSTEWWCVEDMIENAPTIKPESHWIPCSERLPEEYGEYRITWITSYAPSKRFIGDSEYEITSVWDEERKEFKGEWLLDEHIRHYPDVKVIAWKPLEEPYREGEG